MWDVHHKTLLKKNKPISVSPSGLRYSRCGYSKAFQDSDEEKMHYQNGHGMRRTLFP